MHLATPITSESPSLWPQLPKFGANTGWVKIQVNRSKYSYLLVCIDYMGERGRRFPAEDDFLALAGWPTGTVNLVSPPRPDLAADDKLRAEFSCTKLKKPHLSEGVAGPGGVALIRRACRGAWWICCGRSCPPIPQCGALHAPSGGLFPLCRC
jgi:hypothetical protein